MPRGTCHYCERLAAEQCPTCGRLYCAEHGEDVCLRCLAPELAMPNVWTYRGSLLAIVAGVAVTVYLLVSPPATRVGEGVVRSAPTVTPAARATATSTPRAGATPGGGLATSPAASPTAGVPTPQPSPGGERTYTVKEGDTLSAIAAAHATSVEEIVGLNPGLAPDTLSIGQIIRIPPAR